MTTMMPITKGGAGLVRQYSAQYRPGQASVQQRKLFRPQSVLARSETSKVSSFVAAAASELQVRMWWKAGGGREILDGWQTKEGEGKGSGEIPEKVAAYFSAVFDHHHHSEDQAGTLWVLPMHYWGPTIQWGGGFLRNHRWNLSKWKSIKVLFVLLVFSFLKYWIVNDHLTNWLMQNYILLPIIQYRHTPHWFPYALGTWVLMIV